MSVVVVVVVLLTTVLGTCSNVVEGPARRWDEVFRYKRQSTVRKRGFTLAEKQELVMSHNKYRSKEPASDMRIMEWDNSIAQVAQSYADRCVWTHSKYGDYKVPKFRYIGENLFASSYLPTPQGLVKDWADETKYYNYYTGQCSHVCGHYTQIVWADSYALGCGVSHCPTIQGLTWGGYVVVCNYGPGGNYVGQKPYTRGRPTCSDCSEDFPYCVQGLCSKTEHNILLSTTNIFHQQSVTFVFIVSLLVYWLS